ncbi:dehydrodolichyl diphosphate synthase complex subunit NUS1-like isoform X2 [Hordeum vulgare subsp. vulgare]|uniref:dehydrodolichyl diphosphate synthase complex subunit NUS1-like isoform X2 n=1 Tax=Hordeum vulgare subsp. vulgare TaxID=112509 RepID=UPI001D1A5141|nr:dehydrodolichyl diphosphate synthase complex subunit NUS1-like isoform X2 [Hordeum vulgare subsp. vulgare]
MHDTIYDTTITGSLRSGPSSPQKGKEKQIRAHCFDPGQNPVAGLLPLGNGSSDREFVALARPQLPPPRCRCGRDAAGPGVSAAATASTGGTLREAFVANETTLLINKPPPHMSLPSMIIKLTLGFLWCIIHLAISLLSLCSLLIFNLECCLISSGLLWKYWNLQLAKLKYLAIVVDSREAKNTVKINQLLCWLKTLGVKYVCLYDIDGVLKKLFEPGMDGSRDNKPGDYLDVSANTKALGCCQRQMTIECISGSDGKEGIAKAANLLCSTFLNGDSYTQENVKSEENIKSEPVFTETDMANALKSIGCAGPEPDLLLVYGPARCHLGFPTWRLRYTEIMHMGPLKSMKYGALVKAFHNFSKKYQNYGK